MLIERARSSSTPGRRRPRFARSTSSAGMTASPSTAWTPAASCAGRGSARLGPARCDDHGHGRIVADWLRLLRHRARSASRA